MRKILSKHVYSLFTKQTKKFTICLSTKQICLPKKFKIFGKFRENFPSLGNIRKFPENFVNNNKTVAKKISRDAKFW